jgi:hypothetical protein
MAVTIRTTSHELFKDRLKGCGPFARTPLELAVPFAGPASAKATALRRSFRRRRKNERSETFAAVWRQQLDDGVGRVAALPCADAPLTLTVALAEEYRVEANFTGQRNTVFEANGPQLIRSHE